ncbi:hypothetical protein Lesp02_01890 [Lentzea sp. NBRC 105346]|uniref:helix-turn-helix domain-containing protein n=1 Tax=Lentzea sp. NBRC 105346 TaxID=3032205 RepID=UPI0024A3173A|nr:hypothetical protein [Lentzea sp. NBRC 105346]GLZ27999.1 hypothetical protein Lesp02_01890 [Lentzea sp. NBRC 105346]
MDNCDPTFAVALRTAMKDSGLSLEGVARRLRVRGSAVSVGTLSHWQSGRSEPSRRESLRAVEHLETVLGLHSGALRGLVRPPHLRGRPTLESRMRPVAAADPRGDRVRELLGRVDMSSDERLMRVSQHDRCRVGADRSKESLVVRQVLRATHDGPDRFVVAFWQPPGRELPRLRALRGCRVGTVVTDPEWGIFIAELLFPRTLARGETVVTEHELLGLSPAPDGGDDAYGRVLRHPAREYLVEIDFDPGVLPEHCAEVTEPEEGAPVRRPLPVGPDGRTHALALGFGPGLFEVRWHWDAVA